MRSGNNYVNLMLTVPMTTVPKRYRGLGLDTEIETCMMTRSQPPSKASAHVTAR